MLCNTILKDHFYFCPTYCPKAYNYACRLIDQHAGQSIVRLIKRPCKTRWVTFRWQFRERVLCWCWSDRVGPLVPTSSRPSQSVIIGEHAVCGSVQSFLLFQDQADFQCRAVRVKFWNDIAIDIVINFSAWPNAVRIELDVVTAIDKLSHCHCVLLRLKESKLETPNEPGNKLRGVTNSEGLTLLMTTAENVEVVVHLEKWSCLLQSVPFTFTSTFPLPTKRCSRVLGSQESVVKATIPMVDWPNPMAPPNGAMLHVINQMNVPVIPTDVSGYGIHRIGERKSKLGSVLTLALNFF